MSVGAVGVARPLRVVYVDHCAELSGAQLALKRLLDALGDEVQAVVLLAEEGPLAASLRDAGHGVEIVPWMTSTRRVRGADIRVANSLVLAAGAVTYAGRLAARIRELQPALVHTNSLKAAVYGPLAARMAGVPVLVQVRDRIAPDFLPNPARRLVRMAMAVLPDALSGYEAVLPTLGATRAPQFVSVDPVDPRCFDVISGSEPAGCLRIGMSGRIVRWKGQDVFLRAFAEAFPQGQARAVLVGAPLCGEDDYESELHALVRTLRIADRVEFRGFCADVPSQLRQLDVVVHASVIPEPFGQVITEAMAAGLPMVASAAGGPKHIIDDGRTGLLFPPGDVGALAAALRALADDPSLRTYLGQAARRRARDFSGDVVARQVLEVYRSVLATKAASPSSALPGPAGPPESWLCLPLRSRRARVR